MKLKIFSVWIPLLLVLVSVLNSSSAVGQNHLGLDKSGKVKRIHYYPGDYLRVKLANADKVSGVIEAIHDSSFFIDGREIKLDSVAVVYSTRGGLKWVGGLLMTGGLFYLGIDVVNNVFNSRGYAISNSTVVPVSVALGAGAVCLYFGTRSTKVLGKNNFKILNTRIIPIGSEGVLTDAPVVADTNKYVIATLSKLDLDGCNWVITLANGQKLEPVNIQDFMHPDDYSANQSLQIKIRYNPHDGASICMVGPLVFLTSYEKLGPVN